MGRPKGAVLDRPFQIRLSDEFLGRLDKWRREQADIPGRSEAIRRLVEQGLKQ